MPIRVETPTRTGQEVATENLKNLAKGLWIAVQTLFGLALGAGVGFEEAGVIGGFFSAIAYGALLFFFWFFVLYRSRAPAMLRSFKDRLLGVAKQEPLLATPEPNVPELPKLEADDTIVGEIIPDPDTPSPGNYLCLSSAIRNRHTYLIGKTRTGKTTLIKQMILQDIRRGAGVGFIDPAGDAAEDLLGLIPEERIKDVIYFDPTSKTAPAFNPFALPFAPPKLTEDIVSVFRMLVGESWGPRMEHLLRFGVLTLIADKEPHSLRDLKTLYLDDESRSAITAGVTNEQLLEFWDKEYPMIPRGSAGPILNKLSAFLAPMSDLERVFSTTRNDLDFSEILNTGKILIVNLAKGAIGDEPSRLLGGLIVAGIQQGALARVSIPPEERKDFYFYVDEFQNFTVASFASILSESAKYRLNLTLANQYLDQIPPAIRQAIFGNVATLVAFRVSAQDAPYLKKEMHRSRIVVRTKESGDFYRLRDFVRAQRETYQAALADKYLGMNARERQEHRRSQSYGRASGMMDAVRMGQESADNMNDRREQIYNTLEVLDQDYIDVKTLRELFPDYEFRETTFPDVDDFLNLPPHHAFCRIESADNVSAIHCLPPEHPDPKTAQKVLDHLKRYALPAPKEQITIPRKQMEAPVDFKE